MSSEQIDGDVDDALLHFVPKTSPTCSVDFPLVVEDGTSGTVMLVHFTLSGHMTECRKLELREQGDAYMRNQFVHRLLVSHPRKLQ